MRSRVLVFTTRFPAPPDRGDRLHAYHLVRVFAQRFEVTLACFEDEPERMAEGLRLFESWGVRTVLAPLPALGRLQRLAAGVLGARPLQVAYFDEPGLVERIRELDRREGPFDASVTHMIRAVPLAKAARARRRAISLCDSLALSLKRRLSHAPVLERPSIWLEAGRVRRFEAHVLDGFDEGWVVSEVDRAAFPTVGDKMRVLPNGVDERLLEGEIPSDPPSFVGFVGHLGVPHNVDAAVILARRILPLLRARGLDVRVRFVGPEPAPAVRALGELENVELAGYASNLRQSLQGFRVMCAPLRFSAGVQNKVLEAVAAGVPAVTSPAAVTALGPEASRWIRSAETPEEYADAIAQSWERTPETLDRCERGRLWIAGRFRWGAYADRLQELMEQ